MARSVFISYASPQRGVADDLEDELTKRGITVYRDRQVMRGGGDWEAAVLPLVPNAEKFVLLWSKAAAESIPVAQEIVEALRGRVDIVPLRLDDTPKNPLLVRYPDFSYVEAGLRTVLEALAPSVPGTSLAELQRDAVITAYRKALAEEVQMFPVLMGPEWRSPMASSARSLEAKDVIRLNVVDDVMPGDATIATPRDLDIVSMMQSAAENSILLIGHPGAGKSTSTRYLTRHLLGADGGPAPFIPFLAHCKHFLAGRHSSILDFVYNQVGALLSQPHVEEALKTHGLAEAPEAVLLIDGFDELPSGATDTFLERLKTLREDPAFRCARIILTSRFDAYRQYESRFGGWRKLTLAPLSPTQIATYVSHWFGDAEAGKELREQLREPRLAELAVRPFLLAMICLVKDDGGDLGQNRSQLYDKAIRYLEKRQVSTVTVAEREMRRRVLEELAMRMLQLGAVDADRWTAASVVGAVISNGGKRGVSFEECVAFLEATCREIGVTQVAMGEYSFVHRTFLEFLAACRLKVTEGNIAICVDHCNVARWEEPIRLFAGMQSAAVHQAELVKRLWAHNPALALRTLTDAREVNSTVLGSLIANSDAAERVRMLRTLRTSLRDVEAETRLRFVLETAVPLLNEDRDSEVIYNTVSLVRWVDPDDKSRILWNAFGRHAALKRQNLGEPKMLFALVDIPEGRFIMGDDGAVDLAERPAHEVTLSAFKMSSHQITNSAFECVTGRDPSERNTVSKRDQQPVVGVNWYDAYVFALAIGCRLPTEAEWEYAARAGSVGGYCFGDDLALLYEYANYEAEGASKGEPWDVGTARANAFGLFDMHGNVWEWCADWFGEYSSGAAADPVGPMDGTARVRRGGGFAYHARGCRSAFRWGNDPTYRFKDIGIRVVLDQHAVQKGW